MRDNAALRFVVLLGLVSLLADVTYEGARSITGPYLSLLGASAAAVGLVAGAGELIGYALRLASGALADRTRRYWLLTIAGYTLNLAAVPLLALAGRWEIAAALMIAERTGKAIRTPARDAMLAHATKTLGRGWGFGLHEAMDQIGALAGPLFVAAALARSGRYQNGFALLAIPAALALVALLAAWRTLPRPEELEARGGSLEGRSLPRAFWLYAGACGLMAAGFVDFPLIAYHLKRAAQASDVSIPLLYALAMGVDAVAALVFGRLFDRFGVPVLMLGAALAAGAAPLLYLGGVRAAILGMALWGAALGAQESIVRAAVAGFAPPERRASAYGVFSFCFGVSWFAGSAAMGFLYGYSPAALVTLSVALQILAVVVLERIRRRGPMSR
ncbi:MAG: MFS transporter [Acidobacteria bacterium]|nr:MFS transporter [Acidobacteriota bacterium]